MLLYTQRTMRTLSGYAVMALLFAVFAIFLLYPIALTVRGAFISTLPDGSSAFTLSHVALVFRDPTLTAAMLNSARLAATTTTACLLIALPLAVLAGKYRYPLK